MALTFIFKADGSQYTRGLEKMRSQTASWSGGISRMIIGAFAATAVVAGIKEIISSASDLFETITKAREVFGKSSDEVEAWAETLDSRLGQSKAAALDAAAGFSSMFDILGLGPAEAKRMSIVLVELASDLASFHNTSVDQALNAIASGLRGEMKPLRKFNIMLDDALLKQEAFTQGLFNGTGVLSLSAKAQAAYNIILQQSLVAQGDFERTSDGLANTIRIMKAEITNLAAEFGNNLIPTLLKVMKIYTAVKILFGEGIADKAIVRAEKVDIKRRKGGVQSLVESTLDDPFTKEELQILDDITSSTSELDKVMSNHGMTIFDLHLATIDFMKAQEEQGKVAAQNAASAADQAKEQIKLEKDLIKEHDNRIKSLEKLRETIAKAAFESLADKDKKKKLEDEKVGLEKTVKFQEEHKPAKGEEDVAEERKLKAQVKLLGIAKEMEKIEKRAADLAESRRENELEAFFGGSAGLDAAESELAAIDTMLKPVTSIIASSLASIGGGGNVASFTSDPILAANLEANKILLEIKKNTQKTPAFPTTPEI